MARFTATWTQCNRGYGRLEEVFALDLGDVVARTSTENGIEVDQAFAHLERICPFGEGPLQHSAVAAIPFTLFIGEP
jgi:hypothetical protein